MSRWTGVWPARKATRHLIEANSHANGSDDNTYSKPHLHPNMLKDMGEEDFGKFSIRVLGEPPRVEGTAAQISGRKDAVRNFAPGISEAEKFLFGNFRSWISCREIFDREFAGREFFGWKISTAYFLAGKCSIGKFLIGNISIGMGWDNCSSVFSTFFDIPVFRTSRKRQGYGESIAWWNCWWRAACRTYTKRISSNAVRLLNGSRTNRYSDWKKCVSKIYVFVLFKFCLFLYTISRMN